MMKRIFKIKSVVKMTLLILIVLIISGLSFSSIKADDNQEVIEINGQKISYRDGGYVYINKEHSIAGGEFRGVWVSPLTGDIGNYVNKESYQSQMINVLKTMERYNLNVMIFHVRIMNDALYESKYNSWSSYYSTNPDWDMLPWLIEECHKRGIEFHAWMNPYRVTTNVSLSLEECAKRYKATNAASNPKNLLKATSTIILNPGIPEVQRFLVDTCMELVENYDVDAIHFDDYFYAAGIDDSETIREYNSNNLSEDNFRRSQVDAFIEGLSNELRAYNEVSGRRVQLGIAPTGVWKNGNGVVTYDSDGKAISSGSRTSAYAHYGAPLYADTLKWINNNWIDYILPQTYWAITNSAGPYCDLVKWWNAACKNAKTNLYSSLGLYMSAGGNASWSTNPFEGYQQIMLGNTLPYVRGSSIYNYTSYAGASTNPDKAFRNVRSIWGSAAYLPEIRTMDPIVPGVVKNLTVEENDYGETIRFDKSDDAKFYVIYRSEKPITFSDDEIVDVIGNVGKDNKVEYTFSNNITGKTYYYGVKAQSNSLTLGDGATVSSNSVKGENISLGDLTGVALSSCPVENHEVSVKFDEIVYPFGTSINYEVVVAFYEGSQKVSSVLAKISPVGYGYKATFTVPKDATSIEVKIKASNSCGETVVVNKYDVYKDLGNITNFDIYDTTGLSGDRATFIWNNTNVNGIKYVLEYSYDDFDYYEYQELNNPQTRSINLIYDGRLVDHDGTSSKRVYYRIKGIVDSSIAYSDVISFYQYHNFGKIENFKVNGDRKLREVNIEEGDVLTLEWSDTNSKAIYTVLVSYDGDSWIGVNAYNTYADTVLVSSKYQCTIPIRYTHYIFYVKVEVLMAGKKAESDVVKVYVQVDDLYCDDVARYLNDYYNIYLQSMNIFK